MRDDANNGSSSNTRRRGTSQRIPNAERTEATRSALLQATIEAIVRYGYAGASSTRIAEISGLTRGAQKHHFKSKADLVSVALVEVQSRLQAEVLNEMDQVAENDIKQIVLTLWKSLVGDLHTVAIELRIAARSDENLREMLITAEREIGRNQRDFLLKVLDDGSQPRERLAEAGELILNALRGMASQRMLYADTRREERQLRVVEEAARALLRRGDAS